MFYNFLRVITIFIFFCLNSFAFEITDLKDYQNLNKEIKVLFDSNDTYNIRNLPFEEFYLPQKLAFGYVKGSVWSKLELHSKKDKNILLINPKININILDVYIFEDNVLIKTHNLGNYRTISQNFISSKFTNINLELKENKKYTIISKLQSKSVIDATWFIAYNNEFLSFIIYDTLFWGLLFGVVLSLIIYNISIYASLKNTKYIAYSFHGLTALLFQFSTNGIFYQFEFYSNPIIFNSVSWSLSQLSLLSILWFLMLFFNTKKTMPLIHKFIFLLFIFIFLMLFLFIYSFFDVEIINTVRTITKPLSLFILLFVFGVAIYGLRKKIEGSFYYFLGHGIFLITLFYQQFSGIIVNEETNLLSMYIVALGMLFDVTFLSLALGKKFKTLKENTEMNQKLLVTQSGFSAIGRTIGNLSHQWKIPISRLGSLLTQMEATLWKRDDKLKNELNEIIISMRESLNFMQNSITEFNNFYLNSNQKTRFNLSKEIENIINLLSAKTMYSDCSIEKNLSEEIEFFGHKNAFANVCLIIIDNALDIIKQRKILQGKIIISISKKNEKIVLKIEDNGGGIDITPINKIFEVFVSEKENGNGMGLTMCKILVENNLDGTIEVFNNQKGATFKIVF
ncbi:sensor histidine kinase [Arcobacter aquimarinus]|uniref:histidine kinase n=1 Tax=Arcobacter aquimarinus TaxID=1315211 RepID=A0AAE7E084_9BACT|nr:sensor histidine kinase [Arcobacter aquimarinus]QKE25748.1 7TMR-DISM-7TM/7TMR-DISMED2 domain-containing two-component system sensor histidine kinase [Arcobacter aquimarinus]